MLALHIIGWIAVAIGAATALYGATEAGPAVLVAGIGAVVSGILYLALARGLDLLADIRDRLTPATFQPDVPQAITQPAGSLNDLEHRLAAIKNRTSEE